MDKLVLVYYVGVGNMNQEDVPYFIESLSEKIISETLDAEVIMIPTLSTDTRIECINPKYITEEDLIKKNNILLGELNEHLKFQLDNLNQNNDGKHV